MIPATDGLKFSLGYRSQAWSHYEQLPLPTTKDEAWRRTDLRHLEAGTFQPAGWNSQQTTTVPEELLLPPAGEAHGGQIVLRPDGVQKELHPHLEHQGVIFTDLLTAEKDHPKALEKILGQAVKSDESKFAAMAAALADRGILIYIPPNVQVEQPLHSVLWGAGSRLAYFSHLLVYVDRGASATYIHEAASPTEVEGQTLHAGLVEIIVAEGARLHFVELQSWGEHVWNFTHERALVGQDAQLEWTLGALGSHLTKNFSDLNLVGRGALGKMSGFYFADGVQHLDHDTQQNHLAPNTTSDLLFKGALTGRSRSVWQGMIYVAPEAQKADGYQANRNLILSEQARADSIPGLEILADDVRCTHGATAGNIDSNHLLYLLSRGIPQEDAVRLLVDGFFEPIIQRIPYEGIRKRLEQAITEKMS
jgi:Fe-S cluster assembly protein SufD